MSDSAPEPRDHYDRVSDILREASGMSVAVEVLDSPEVEQFMGIWNNLPMLPFTQETRYAMPDERNLVCGMEMFPDQSFVEITKTISAIITKMARDKSGSGSTAPSVIINGLKSLVDGGRYQPVTNALKRIWRKGDEGEYPRCLTSIVLLNISSASAARGVERELTPEENELHPAERAALIGRRVDVFLRQMCRDIADGVEPRPVGDSVELTVARNAMRALRACYNIGESDQELQLIVAPILATRVAANISRHVDSEPEDTTTVYGMYESLIPALPEGEKRISTRVILEKAKARLLPELALNGFDVDSTIYERDDGSLNKPRGGRSNEGNLREQVDFAHAQIRVRQTARALVSAIASGDIAYCSIHLAALRMSSPVLKMLAMEVKLDRQAAAARAEAQRIAEAKRLAEERELEEARLQDLGWLSVQLKLSPDNEVDVEFLPSATGTKAPQTRAEDARRRADKERIATVEKHRLLTLIRLQEIYPGSVIRFRTLKNRKGEPGAIPRQRPSSDDSPDIVDPMKVDGHVVLVLPNGSAVGESLQPGNATVIFRPETWYGNDPAITWEDVFEFDKQNVKDFATIRVQHPDKRDLEADYVGTVESYLLLILEDLERPLRPGETLPDLHVMRNLRRALGGRATSATVGSGVMRS